MIDLLDGQVIGIIAAILGGVLGLCGGVIGMAATTTEGPITQSRQSRAIRQFIIRSTVVCFLFVAAFITALLLLPDLWRKFIWVPYGIMLVAGVFYFNQHIKVLEAKELTE